MTQHVVAPSWSTCSQIEFGRSVGARRARGRFGKKVWARQGVTDASARQIEPSLLNLGNHRESNHDFFHAYRVNTHTHHI